MNQEPNPFPGKDRASVERAIFNEMRPPSLVSTTDGWKLSGLHFESVLKNRANDHEPWSYIENGKKIGFAHEHMRWSNGKRVKSGANASVGVIDTESSPVSLTYPDALGAGINVKIIQDNYRWQKIVEIESLASLGEIPADAEYLEISFKMSGDFALPEGVIYDPIPFGDNIFLQPVRAWDSSPPPEDPVDEVMSGAVGVVAGDVVTKRIPVAWLKDAAYPVRADLTITFGAENVFNSASTTALSVAALDSTHFVVAYKDAGGDGYGIARIGLVSGTTISSYGAENVFNAATTEAISVAALDSTHFVVAYQDVGNSSRGTGIIGLTDGGTTISSYGAENVFNSITTISISVAALNSTHFVVGYRSGSNGYAKVGSVTGTTINLYGTGNIFNFAVTEYISVAALDSTHFVVAYKDDGGDDYGIARIGLTDGGTIISSYGAENVFNSAVTNYVVVAALDSTHFVVGYCDLGNSNYGTAIVGVVSGTTISSYGAENVFNSADTYYIKVAALDATHFVVVYRDVGNSNYLTAIVGIVSGTTISSYSDESVFKSVTTYAARLSVAALDSTHFVVAYQDAGGADYGCARVGDITPPVVAPTSVFIGPFGGPFGGPIQ